MPKLLGSAADILERIVDIAYPQRGSRIRHQLHQPHCALSRHGIGTKIRLNLDHRA
jgi:hypothetical protein